MAKGGNKSTLSARGWKGSTNLCTPTLLCKGCITVDAIRTVYPGKHNFLMAPRYPGLVLKLINTAHF